jgi:hypothetical protein
LETQAIPLEDDGREHRAKLVLGRVIVRQE